MDCDFWTYFYGCGGGAVGRVGRERSECSMGWVRGLFGHGMLAWGRGSSGMSMGVCGFWTVYGGVGGAGC